MECRVKNIKNIIYMYIILRRKLSQFSCTQNNFIRTKIIFKQLFVRVMVFSFLFQELYCFKSIFQHIIQTKYPKFAYEKSKSLLMQ